MSRHAHASDRAVMALAGLVAVACAAVCWSGLVRAFGGAIS